MAVIMSHYLYFHSSFGEFSNISRCWMIVLMCFCAHSVNWIMNGTRDVPVSVKLYSTLGGTIGWTILSISSSASNVRSVPESTRDDMSSISLPSSLKRKTLFSLNINMTNNAHLLPKRVITFRTGHISMTVFVFSFFSYYVIRVI